MKSWKAFVVLIQTLHCLALDDSPFQLTNKDTGFCLVKTNNQCSDIRWTTSDRLLVQQRKKCLGVQGKSVGSEISLYDCDENSDLQKWECKNGTLLALKDQALHIELTADNIAVLSKTVGPNNHLTITGTPNGACTRTYRELFAIGGNAAGLPCMFPFHYKDQWFSDCTTLDSPGNTLWCAVETKYQTERWGYCPVTSKDGWTKHPTTGAYYQLNTGAALTQDQAEASCKQQGASLLSITDPHEQAYLTALLGSGGNKIWTGLIVYPEHGWKWTDGKPYRYLKWDSGYVRDYNTGTDLWVDKKLIAVTQVKYNHHLVLGHPLPNPGHNCAILEPAVEYSWQSSLCSKKLGYICYSEATKILPTQAVETGFCSSSWIPYSGHCFYLNRTKQSWSDAQRLCRDDGGDLVSMRNVEDQSFVVSQLGYASTDELWIGLNDRKTEGLFEWIDHSTVTFTSWEFGKPAVSTDLQDCVLIRGENGNWADRVCEEKHGYICMKMSASKPTGDKVKQDEGCKNGWRRHGSYCYLIAAQTKTFDEAKDDCKSSASYLADVSNAVDNAFLISLVGMRPEKYFWLGLSNQKNIDQFEWTNTDSVKFTHWNAGMPGHQQGCVAMTTGIFAGLWDVLPCTRKEKYICKHLAKGAVLTPAPPTLTPSECPLGWTRVGTRNYCCQVFSGSSSYSMSNGKTWFEARDYCRARGGDLLSIHSKEELRVLHERYESVWIGLSAPDPATGYVWSDGSAVQFQHWEDGEPNNKNNVESCAVFKLYKQDESGSWNDLHCEMYKGWVCQIRLGVTPKPPPSPAPPDYNRTSDGWLEWRGSQYYLNTMAMAMEEARRSCQERHSDLVTISSEAESVFLWKRMAQTYGDRPYWIGLNVDLDKTYGWMDGSPVVFQRWDEDQPKFRRNDENCAAMLTFTGFWHVYNCGHEHRFVCKRSSSPPANATVPPTVTPKGGCPQNWQKFNSKCYNIITSQKETWFGARTQCKSMGGNLASILSRKVQVFLAIKLAEPPTTDLWIGLHTAGSSPFLWTDGRPMRYNCWGSERGHSYHSYHSMYHNSEMDYDIFHRPSRTVKNCAVMTTDTTVGTGKWLKKNCNDTNGYICLRSVDSSLPDSAEPTTSTNYVKIFNDSIKVVTQKMSWGAAKKHCEGDGAKLASLRNQWTKLYAELTALNLDAPVWIGLNKKETGGYFRYIDGWRMTSTYWNSWEPRGNLDCVFANKQGLWETADCNRNMSSICMKSTDVPPTEQSDFPGFCPEDPETPRYLRRSNNWQPFRANCFLFFTERVEWQEASTNCARHGGTLASIEDPSEQSFILSSLQMFRDSQSSFWIGLYRTHRGTWQWLDRTPLDYTNWGESPVGRSTFGSVRATDGMWTTGQKWYDKGYVCKAPKVLLKVAQTTATPTMQPQTRGHTTLVVLLVITALIIGTAIALFLFKKSGRRLPIPEKLSTFDNPLFFNNERFQPGLVDTKKLVANAEEENPAPVLTV